MSRPPLPPCPSCHAPLSAERVMEQGRSGIAVHATISCGACLSVSRLEWSQLDSSPSIALRAAGTIATRLHDALRAARERGDAEGEVRRVLADPERGFLLAAPEVAEEAVAALGKDWRLSKSATLMSPWYTSPAVLPPAPWVLSPGHSLLRREDVESALKGSELGGFVVPPHYPSSGQVVILAAQRLTLSRLNGIHRVFEIPAFARKRLGVTHFVDPDGLVRPDRVRRPA